MSTSPAYPSVDICVCTFRRAHLERTLVSLDALDRPRGVRLAVLVVDNDETPSARGTVEAFARTATLPVRYIHCPAGNISVARNGALDDSAADYLAFIDDDEVATPPWMTALLDTATQGVDIVLGPVRADYAPDAPLWMRRGDCHSTRPVWVGGEIRTGYSCNVLFRRDAPALQGLRFDPGAGQSGGEDTIFFSAAVRRGARIAYAPAALVTEEVPQGRATFGWLAKRRFRMGQTHGRLVADGRGLAARLSGAGLAAAKLGYCLAGAALYAAEPTRRNAALLRGALHAGAVTAFLGARAIRQYGLPPAQTVTR